MKQKTSAVNQITEGVIWKQLLLFFFPIMLGTLFQQLYNTADAIIVGRFVGKEALACVGGSSGQLINSLSDSLSGFLPVQPSSLHATMAQRIKKN